MNAAFFLPAVLVVVLHPICLLSDNHFRISSAEKRTMPGVGRTVGISPFHTKFRIVPGLHWRTSATLTTLRGFVALLGLVVLSGCGGGGSSGKSFSGSSDALTIDNIVNQGTTASARRGMGIRAISTSEDAAFYYGRFAYWNNDQLYSGSVKFKLKKQNDSSAYFSDFTLEHYSRIDGLNSSTNVVTSSTSLDVTSAYDATSNHVEISNSTKRFVGFDLDFGNNMYFGDIQDAGVIFSADYTTMAGGDDDSFFFIAQKVDSQPNASESALSGNWDITNFTVNSSTGAINETSTSTVEVGGTGGNGFTAFTGENSATGSFDGELSLTDAVSGAFVFGFGVGDGSSTALGVDGGFLVSADQSLALGIDVTTGTYFAAEH